MKKFIITSILLALFIAGPILLAQDQNNESLGLPGDNLNLYAVMKIFQESETLEGFERTLNDENSRINNLDLNGDNMVDYIKVIDYVDGDVHNIVLQVPVNNRENQDVAVFTVQRYNNGQVQIQLIGDEALYGSNYIIEPIFDEANNGQTPNPGYTGNTRTINGRNITVIRTTPVEIATWPLVRFIYLPGYVTWHSSWYYDYYPPYWRPWSPYYWDFYYGYHYNCYDDYYAHYRRWDNHRYANWNNYYWVGKRAHSANVSVRIREGNYKSTYSRPDQRRDGEAMYTKMNPAQNNRSGVRSSESSTVRRSGSRATPEKQSKVTGTTRRSSATVTKKSATNPSSGKNTVTTRRSATKVTNKSVAKPPTGRNTGTARPSRQSTKAGVNSPGRRNSAAGKSAVTPKRSDKATESETTKATRRR
jgi:hypothetical protein